MRSRAMIGASLAALVLLWTYGCVGPCSDDCYDMPYRANAPIADAQAEADADAGGDDSNLPNCAVSPGISTIGTSSAYPPTALPSGACSGAPRCSIAIDPCCHPTGNELIDGYACTCSGGQWSCVIFSPGGGVCSLGIAPNCIDGG